MARGEVVSRGGRFGSVTTPLLAHRHPWHRARPLALHPWQRRGSVDPQAALVRWPRCQGGRVARGAKCQGVEVELCNYPPPGTSAVPGPSLAMKVIPLRTAQMIPNDLK